MTEAEKLEKRLTAAQRRALVYGRWPPTMCENREEPVKNALIRKGICAFHHRAGGKGDFLLTALGREVQKLTIANKGKP